VCQTAAMLILEPIFEADMPQEQHAYRQNRNAQSAVREVRGLLASGHKDVVDATYPDTWMWRHTAPRFMKCSQTG
jgi:RNA-directed DNA polymerase